jgi:CRP/FNR family transcriptional regulator, cyclic AMP receptor protein
MPPLRDNRSWRHAALAVSTVERLAAAGSAVYPSIRQSRPLPALRTANGGLIMSLGEILGYAALLLLLASYAMKTINLLRILAIAASLVIILYAVLAEQYPVLVIAVLILIINVYRLIEMRRMVGMVRQATAASSAPPSIDWLMPHMTKIEAAADQVLFRRGDVADAMYFISSGRIRFEEIGVEVGKGNLFGEIGIFTNDQLRTATAKCAEASSLMKVSADKARELYYQNPEFGFFLVGLITRRLMEDAKAGAMKP